jgi:beta-lactamase regulating signal transducer with metallopeptidase domain
MNAILEQINSAGSRFVEFALPMFVQSGVLILILLLADFALRKKVRAVFRYWIWMLVLVKLILPTSLSTPVSVGNLFGDELAYVNINQPAIETEAPELALAIVPPAIDLTNIQANKFTPSPAPIIPAVEPAMAETLKQPVTPLSWQGAVFLLWAAVVLTMGLLLLQRAIFVRGLVAQAKEANSLMNDTFVHCRKRVGVKNKVGLKVPANAASPAVCGLFRPVILVPQNLTSSLSPSHLRAVLLHELAHIRRGDLWVNLVQTILQIIYFYNPLLWLANTIIRRIREQAVDEMVLVAMGEKAQQYPQTLVDVAKLAFKRPALSLRLIGVVESKSALAGRIKHILNRPIPKKAKLGILGLAVVIITAAILLPMATCTPGPPSLVIKGTVKDAQTGEPIAGARVFDDGYGPKPNWEQIRADVRSEWGAITNSAGEYSFLTWPEHHTIKVEAPGYKAERQTLYDGHFTFNKKDQETFNFALEPEKASDSSEFKITLTNRVTVELVGLGKNPWESKQEWWRPDGVEIEKPGYKTNGPPFKWPTNPNGLQFQCAALFKFSNHQGKNVSVPEVRFSKKFLQDGLTSGIADDETQITYIVRPPNKGVFAQEVYQKTDILLAIGSVPFKKAKTPSKKFNEKMHETYFLEDNSAVIRHPLRVDNYLGTLTVDLTCPEGDFEFRVIAELKNGQTEQWHGGSVGKKVRFFHATPRRENIKVEDIEQLIIEYRPYDWVTFRNVSLQPGFKTDVQVEVELEKPTEQVKVEGGALKQLSSEGGYQNLSREQRERLERLRANRQSLSYKNMQKLGLAVAMFANDHKGRCPSNLSDLRKYIADEQIFDWINRNVVYLGRNQQYREPPDAVLAYDESMLKKPRQETNVLYNDAHVSLEKSEWLKLKASSHHPGQKPDVQVEVEQGNESSESINTEDYDRIPSDSVVVRVVDTKGRIIPIKDVPYTRIYYRDATTGSPIGWEIDLQIKKALSDGSLLVNHRDILVRKFLDMNRETKRNDYTISMCFQPKEGPVFSATTLYPRKATDILSFVVPPRMKVAGVGNVAPDELAGRVVDVDGNPVAGATISVYPDRGLENHPFKTDSRGVFRIPGFGDRWCLYIKVDKDGYATQWLTDFEIGKGFIVTMDQSTVLQGVFVNDSGERAGRTQITLAKNKLTMQPRRGNRVGPITFTHETDDKGSYDFPVEPGLYDVKVASESGFFNRSRVFIGAGQIVSLQSTLKPGIRFQVKVVDSLTNKPIKGVDLWIDSRTPGRVAMKEGSQRTTDSKGLAVWESLMPGNTSFSIRKKGYCRWWSDACLRGLGTLEPVKNRAAYSWQRNIDSLGFDLIPDMPVVVIKMEKGVKLSGLVLSPDGKPVEKAEVDVTPVERPHTLTGDSRYRMITDENGRFGIEEKYWRGYVPAGKQVLYNLCAHDPEARWANAVSKPFESKPADEFEFTLKMTKGGSVSGRVIDSEGKPVPDIEVEAVAKDNLDTPYFNPRALTDENGNFTLGPMREGKYWIQPDTMKGVNIARSPKQEKTEVKVVDGKVTSVGSLLFRTGGPNM